MTAEQAISIDIGSTFTKGAAFSLRAGSPSVLCRSACPTTQDDLAQGFREVLDQLRESAPEAPVYFSSSAKGGLAVAAIGLVPDLTLQLARQAAMSAGGKVVCHFAFSLTRDDVAKIESVRPDILLFCGGTDGGNSRYILENAEAIAASNLDVPIIYAGNRAVADRVVSILEPRQVTVVPNLMPEIHVMNIEPVRAKICEIFLQMIVAGKGLADIVRQCGTGVRPTPLGVYELIGAIPEMRPDWNDICAVDLGGATTDFYSNTESYLETDSVVLKGLREPRLKRTVEGDLGLRISIAALLDSAADTLDAGLSRCGLSQKVLEDYAAKLMLQPEHVAATAEEQVLDNLLAEACVYHAALRHVGRMDEAFTPQGRIYLQTGKDLRRVRRIIGTGGFLSCSSSAGVMQRAFECLSGKQDKTLLVPEKPVFYADSSNLFPLLGNLAVKYPEAAVELALENLTLLK